jgi:beta-phosphoglucomutase-like phosphatase (HAD superfamily)
VPEAAPVVPPVDLNALRARWRTALAAADAALHAGERYLGGAQLHEHRVHLADEYAPTVRLLRELARDEGIALYLAQPFLPPGEARRLLGLPPTVKACVFNLDGVLVGSAAVHAAAWTRTFDEFLSRWPQRAEGGAAHFDPHVDYPAHVHGRPRLEGVRTFLASRGIRLPEGTPADPPGADTVHGLANRKNEVLVRLLDEGGIAAYEGAQRYLELAHDAGLRCAVVSASANTEAILERTGLAGLVDRRVDAALITAEHLRGRPAPDRLLAACRLLEVEPARAAAFETDTTGIAAGRTAGFRVVVGVDRSEHAAHAGALREEGADFVVPGLAELLDRRVAAR